MKRKKIVIVKNKPAESPVITQADFDEFMQARTYEERIKILQAHSQKNNEAIRQRSIKMEKTQEQVEQEMLELNRQFGEFLREKNIFKKFKIAFSNMGENARKQHAEDKARIEEVKSAEENAEFAEFVHTKGFKAKIKLIIENMKKGAKEAPQRTAAQIAKVQAQTQTSIASATAHNPYAHDTETGESTESLVAAFNEFLKSKGLDGEYSVQITEENSDEE